MNKKACEDSSFKSKEDEEGENAENGIETSSINDGDELINHSKPTISKGIKASKNKREVRPRRDLHEGDRSGEKERDKPHGKGEISNEREPILASTLKSKDQPWWQNRNVLGCAVVLLAALILWFWMPVYNHFLHVEPMKLLCKADRNKLTIINSIKEICNADSLPNQSEEFWNRLSPIIKSRINLPSNPQCVLVTWNHSESQYGLAKFANHVQCALSGNERVLFIDGRENLSKSALDQEFDEWFISKDDSAHIEHYVAVLYNVDRLTMKAAEILYKFCDDNDEPLFPRVLLFLTIDASPSDDINYKWLERKLKISWRDSDDDVSPLLSRIGHTILMFNTSKPISSS